MLAAVAAQHGRVRSIIALGRGERSGIISTAWLRALLVSANSWTQCFLRACSSSTCGGHSAHDLLASNI